jgi:DMSO/TMAO reductase YedYZ molybdopterin-dependent catalytic subunit
MTNTTKLPPGQRERGDFPRFGLGQFADRFPSDPGRVRLQIAGDVATPCMIERELAELTRVDQISDFHCVTTWSTRNLHWSGYRFREFYERIVVPLAAPRANASLVVLRAQDGFAASLPLVYMLAADVLLVDRLNGEPLPIAHGAPLRLIAPAHYGYKNAKHLSAIELWCDERSYRSPSLRFMDHPSARVELEERGRGFPGWMLRHLYRPLVRSTVALFERRLEQHERAHAR